MTRSKNPKRYSPEFKDEAAKMVVDLSGPIAQVAQEFGINRTTLGFWVKAYRQPEPADITGPPANITDQPANITGPSAVSGHNAERAELTRRSSAALAGLDHGEREVIELNLRHDLDLADLATVLGMPRNKVDALASRARGKLERAFGALLVARMGPGTRHFAGRLGRGKDAHAARPFAAQQQGRRRAGKHRDGLVEGMLRAAVEGGKLQPVEPELHHNLRRALFQEGN